MVISFCLLGVDATLSDGSGLDNTQFQGSEMSSGLFQDFTNGFITP